MRYEPKIKFNRSATIAKIQSASKAAIEEVTEQIRKDTSQYLPNTGQKTIAASAETHSDIPNGKIVWQNDYARYLFYGILMVDPNTGSAWAEEGEDKVLTKKELNYSKIRNPKAGKLWTYRAYADNHEKWQKIMQASFNKNLR